MLLGECGRHLLMEVWQWSPSSRSVLQFPESRWKEAERSHAKNRFADTPAAGQGRQIERRKKNRLYIIFICLNTVSVENGCRAWNPVGKCVRGEIKVKFSRADGCVFGWVDETLKDLLLLLTQSHFDKHHHSFTLSCEWGHIRCGTGGFARCWRGNKTIAKLQNCSLQVMISSHVWNSFMPLIWFIRKLQTLLLASALHSVMVGKVRRANFIWWDITH